MMSYDQIFDLFELFIKDVFVFIWRIIRPSINNDVVGLFLDLELRETLDLLFLRQEKITLLSFCYLKVLLPSSLLSLNLLLLKWYFFFDCLGGSILDGLNRDVLFLASSVCVC